MKYLEISSFNIEELNNFPNIPSEVLRKVRSLCSAIPFKTNNYILTQLIDWSNWKECSIFKINFPNLAFHPESFNKAETGNTVNLNTLSSKKRVLDSHIGASNLGAEQKNNNSESQIGLFHHFPSTLMLFPFEAQSCFGICMYCYRWRIHCENLSYYYDDPLLPVRYLNEHPEISDVLITGGDALFMKGSDLRKYIQPLLSVKSLKTIRLATRALSWWPYRFLADDDTTEIFDLFEYIKSSEKNCAIMAHISHPDEISTPVAIQAVNRINSAGIIIRSQTPILRGVNGSSEILRILFNKEVAMGIVPYYLFIESSTDFTDFFKLPLIKALEIYNEATCSISGLARTLRGPVLTCKSKKILIDGLVENSGESKIILKCIQSPVLSEVNSIKIKEYFENSYFIDWD